MAENVVIARSVATKQSHFSSRFFVIPAKAGIQSFVTFFFFLFLSSSPLHSAGVGTSAAQFLKVGVAARPVAMGESFVAVANDVTAIFWNPAGLSRLNSKELSASHNSYIQGVNYESLAYAQPASMGTFGLGANYLYLSDIERRGSDESLQGTFGASDMAFSFAFARPLVTNSINSKTPIGRRLLGGINFKVLRQQIDSYSANAYAFDFGLLTPIHSTRMNLGFALQNIGSDVKFLNESYSLPATMRLGLSWIGKNAPVTLSGAVSIPRDNAPSWQFGGEYWLMSSFALRTGYLVRPQNDSTTIQGTNASQDATISALTGFMAGLGLKLSNFQIDYALVPMGDLGTTHRVTLGIKFK